MLWLVIVLAIVVVVALIVVAFYNRLVRLRNRTENAWAQVDAELRLRYDLIPNLVETVKGYASHERGTFKEVTKARTAAQQAQTVREQAQAENLPTQALGRLFAVAEAYPELRATENFQQLQAQLEETESKISPNGDRGSGPSALGIGDLSAGFGSALAPPSSGSGGFGGGFFGGGGVGGGAGGGSAW